ncbi:transketolase family protein [Propionivibrio dicarboxylicus]|uniref:Transketolase n=1 Tax=Propionivibrio dicarboxylicus TaxID=83767 RepID=A0A1G7Z158_9RHOO|nr:transketolase C-terminal domain-containing protein [Propionivibrio dicarboxylicus]SDH02512.1 transketolase [Propionivibrio dicarboxylicus]
MTILDKLSTRDAFGEALLRVADARQNVLAFAADTAKSMGLGPMAAKYPDRVIDVGIAETNMMTAAAGAASVGNLVFAATYSVFSSMRTAEEVRTFIAYPNLNVKVVGGMGGLAGTYEGVTHQATEDIGMMRCIPNLAVVVPADASSTEVITEKLAEFPGPVYLRLGRYAVPKVFDDNYKFVLGKANVIKDSGSDATIICNGVMVGRALQAEKLIAEKGYSVRIVEMATVKPIDKEEIVKSAMLTGCVVTAEEHNVIGGLGAAVAEVIATLCPVPMKIVGINDTFGESGHHEELLDKYGLSVGDIVENVLEVIKSKKCTK